MESPIKTARIAGALYLIVVLTGIFNLMYVPSRLIVWGNAATTFQNIVASETLFRLGILAGITCYTAFLLLPIVLYKLLHRVSEAHAIAMVALAIASVPISLFNLTHKFAILTLISKPEYMTAFDLNILQNQVMLSLHYYNNGIRLVSVFWGLWLLPFGYLVYKSRFIPKILGIVLMVGCFGYLINFVGKFIFQSTYTDLGISNYISLPASLGEIGICLWLLIVATNRKERTLNS